MQYTITSQLTCDEEQKKETHNSHGCERVNLSMLSAHAALISLPSLEEGGANVKTNCTSMSTSTVRE